MTNKEIFIKIVQEMVFDLDNLNEFFSDEEITKAIDFWEDLKNDKIKNSGAMTENGKKLLSWMQKNVDTMTNIFTSKEAAEALFTSGRSIAGTMRKLINDGYVEKIGKNPVRYSLTEKGKQYKFDN